MSYPVIGTGLIVTSFAIGLLAGPAYGILTFGTGLMALGLLGAMLDYLSRNRP